MKIELKDLSPVKKSLAIEADPEEIARETEEVLRGFARQAKIPGFRAGKVPVDIVRTRFAKEIKDDVRDRLLSKLYAHATKEKGLAPIGEPLLDEVVQGDDHSFRFRTTFEVLPAIQLRSHRGIEAREAPAVVAESEVEGAIEELRRSQVKLVTEEGRAATTGDVLVADVLGTPETGDPFRRERMLLEVGATSNLPAFNEALAGAVAGDTREFPVAYPKEYDARNLAGQTVRYRVTVHEVKRAIYPEVDDDFAKDLGEFENVAALRARVRADLEERKRGEARSQVRQAILDKLLLENPIPLPEVLVDEEIQHRLEDLVRGVMMQGVDPRQLEIDWKQIRERQEEPARKSVHARLMLDAVAREESIEVAAGEVEERVRAEAARLGRDAKEIRSSLAKGDGMEALKNQMVREKSLDFLTSVANIHREG